MLTDLNFLSPGQVFPPSCEAERLQMYSDNRALFEGKHSEVYATTLKRIERVIGNFGDVISFPVVVNFQRLMALKIADLLVGEPPQITAGEPGTPEQTCIETIEKTSDIYNTLYETAIDVSRYGDGLLYIRNVGGIGKIELTQPPLWFPIVSSDNVKEIINHVLAWCIKGKTEQDSDTLKVQIHNKGSYEEREYSCIKGEINKLRLSKVMQTGLDDFAVVQVPNVMTSDRVTGLDDYSDIDSIIAEIMVRVGQISRILDKHASPSMQGPIGALEKDPYTGEYKVKAGNYFTREEGEIEVSYITWDGQLAANFTMIEKLTNYLYTISEMGSAIFGDLSQSGGQIASGSALKRLMISPLSKVARIRSRFDPALKRALILCSQLGGKGIVDLTNIPITITWRDGIPNDPAEEAAIMSLRTANKPTMSQYRALTQYDGMTDEDAVTEMGRMMDEESAANPTPAMPFSSDNSGGAVI